MKVAPEATETATITVDDPTQTETVIMSGCVRRCSDGEKDGGGHEKMLTRQMT